MAAPAILNLVKNRLPVSSVVGGVDDSLIGNFIDEVKVRLNYVEGDEPVAEDDLTWLQRGYIADLAAIDLLNSRLDRYMNEAKTKLGNDAVEIEYFDKSKFIKQRIAELREAAKAKGWRLGFGSGTPATCAGKIEARDESNDE